MLDRLKLAQSIDQTVVCTYTNIQGDHLETLAALEGVTCFRGDEGDVIMRLPQAMQGDRNKFLVGSDLTELITLHLKYWYEKIRGKN